MTLTESFKTALLVPIALVAAAVLGGVLGGITDAVALDLVSGTPLGPASRLSPALWTVVGLGVLYAVAEVVG